MNNNLKLAVTLVMLLERIIILYDKYTVGELFDLRSWVRQAKSARRRLLILLKQYR
ncbi:hypothetical protein GCM10007978_37300 [Shewanella hanedai]|nr:hypothetical protein GCM10007978_37300 [Shewanella hanedai]